MRARLSTSLERPPLPNTIQVTGDDDPFLSQQAEVDDAMGAVQKTLQPNDVMICAECEGPIEPERKEVLPSAVTCIECAQHLAKEAARKGKLFAAPETRKKPDTMGGWGPA